MITMERPKPQHSTLSERQKIKLGQYDRAINEVDTFYKENKEFGNLPSQWKHLDRVAIALKKGEPITFPIESTLPEVIPSNDFVEGIPVDENDPKYRL